jgi:dipeptidyl aminopeptidase/acylaminoacyl peptidase
LPPKALEQIWDRYEANKVAILRERSAISWADELNVPLLIMQGSSDPQVNPAQSLALAGKLQSLGKPYQLIIYSGDNHILSRNKLSRDRETIAWFRQHLKRTNVK